MRYIKKLSFLYVMNFVPFFFCFNSFNLQKKISSLILITLGRILVLNNKKWTNMIVIFFKRKILVEKISPWMKRWAFVAWGQKINANPLHSKIAANRILKFKVIKPKGNMYRNNKVYFPFFFGSNKYFPFAFTIKQIYFPFVFTMKQIFKLHFFHQC